MIYGLDTAYPPSTVAARRQFSLGWRFYGGYIGGPRATHAWSHADFERLAAIGFSFIPIYVGRTTPYDPRAAFNHAQGIRDGTEACVQTGACGFNESTILCLDAEYGDWQNEPAGFAEYLAAWVSVVNGAGHGAVLYSDTETLAHFGSDIVDFKWGAAYSSRAFTQSPPVGLYDPASPPPWDVWQYGSGGSIAGTNLDLNSAADDFPLATFSPI